MLVSGAESCCGVQDTLNAWALAIVKIKAKLEGDVQHYTLGGDRKNWALGVGLQHLRIIHKNDRLAMTTSSISRSPRGATSETSD
jgi:hypothetical protein